MLRRLPLKLILDAGVRVPLPHAQGTRGGALPPALHGWHGCLISSGEDGPMSYLDSLVGAGAGPAKISPPAGHIKLTYVRAFAVCACRI